jgi:hypothetical protein
MNNNNSKSLLTVILYVSLTFLLIFFVSLLIKGAYMILFEFDLTTFFTSAILPSIYFFNYFAVVWYLKKIVDSTYDSPFIVGNVLRLKKMGYFLLVNTVFEFFIGLQDMSEIKMVGIGGLKSVKPVLVMCLIATLICFVLADVFNKAIKIKEDNDLTI